MSICQDSAGSSETVWPVEVGTVPWLEGITVAPGIAGILSGLDIVKLNDGVN